MSQSIIFKWPAKCPFAVPSGTCEDLHEICEDLCLAQSVTLVTWEVKVKWISRMSPKILGRWFRGSGFQLMGHSGGNLIVGFGL